MEKEMTSRQKQAIETKKRIYRCAVKLFTEIPFEDVKIKDICDCAGVSVGVFYHYFKEKNAIFNEGYRNFDRDFADLLARTKEDDPLERLKIYSAHYLKTIKRMGPIYRNVFLRYELLSKDPYIVSNTRLFYQTLLSTVSEAVDSELLVGEPADIVNTLLRCIKGVIFDWSLRDGSFDILKEGKAISILVMGRYQHLPEQS